MSLVLVFMFKSRMISLSLSLFTRLHHVCSFADFPLLCVSKKFAFLDPRRICVPKKCVCMFAIFFFLFLFFSFAVRGGSKFLYFSLILSLSPSWRVRVLLLFIYVLYMCMLVLIASSIVKTSILMLSTILPHCKIFNSLMILATQSTTKQSCVETFFSSSKKLFTFSLSFSSFYSYLYSCWCFVR